MLRIISATVLLVACFGHLVSGNFDMCSTEGAEQIRGNYLCSCEYPYFALGQRGDQLQWVCRLNGCENWSDDLGRMIFYKPGASMRLQGSSCRCVEGTDPYLMDARTLYHIKCIDK